MISTLAQYWIDKVVAGSPVGKALQLSVHSAEVDAITLNMPISEEVTTTPGIIHGGFWQP